MKKLALLSSVLGLGFIATASAQDYPGAPGGSYTAPLAYGNQQTQFVQYVTDLQASSGLVNYDFCSPIAAVGCTVVAYEKTLGTNKNFIKYVGISTTADASPSWSYQNSLAAYIQTLTVDYFNKDQGGPNFVSSHGFIRAPQSQNDMTYVKFIDAKGAHYYQVSFNMPSNSKNKFYQPTALDMCVADLGRNAPIPGTLVSSTNITSISDLTASLGINKVLPLGKTCAATKKKLAR